MCSLQCLARGENVVERVVIIEGAERNVGQGGEVCVVPSTVEGDGRVALSSIQLVSTAGRGGGCTDHVMLCVQKDYGYIP